MAIVIPNVHDKMRVIYDSSRSINGRIQRVQRPNVLIRGGLISHFAILYHLFGAAEKQRQLLEQEGVEFDAKDRGDLKKYRWKSPMG